MPAVPMSEPAKDAVRAFWNAQPCGTGDLTERGERARFAELEARRDELEPEIARYAAFERHRGESMLEVGVGAGTDHLRFARAGAKCSGIDLTEAAITMTRRRLELEGLTSDLRVADAESLPFADAAFDFAYSWGVIHHSPSPERAAREILRVLRPDGRFVVMVYNIHSIVAAQAWMRFGLLRGRPFTALGKVIADHVESPGTRAYTTTSAAALFTGARDVRVDTVVTAWDMRVGRRLFLPPVVKKLVPARLGWFHVVSGSR